MTVNAEPQPQVRAGGLPTNTPRTIQRPAQPVAGDPQPAEHSAETAEVAAKPRRKYKPRAKRQIDPDLELTKDEQAAWGRIGLKAMKRGVTPDVYMQGVIGEYGDEIAVYKKLTSLAAQANEAALQPAEGAETDEPAIQA
jgi:hypothetical protein